MGTWKQIYLKANIRSDMQLGCSGFQAGVTKQLQQVRQVRFRGLGNSSAFPIVLFDLLGPLSRGVRVCCASLKDLQAD